MEFALSHVNAARRPTAPSAGAAADAEVRNIPNVVKAKFGHLKKRAESFAGEPVKCKNPNCEAILTSISKVSAVNPTDAKRTWVCEFCSFVNKLLISDGEIPPAEVTFFIKAGPVEQMEDKSFSTDLMKYFVYCIDTSGSMCESTQIDNNIKLPTDAIRQRAQIEMMAGLDIRDLQPINPRSVTRYISRLEAVQVAIIEALTKMEEKNPEKRAVLITFNQIVTVFGDGRADKIKIYGDDLDSTDRLQLKLQASPAYENIGRHLGKLREQVLGLVEGGGTALGPALYYSVILAARKPGGKVLLCTDGLANLGLGRLDNDDLHEESNSFYESIINLALAKGVSVSIVTIEGTNCQLGILGQVATRTKGTIKTVDPLRIRDEFASVVLEKVVANNVVGTFVLPKEFYIKDYLDPTNKQSRTVKQIGSVTEDTEVSFGFDIRANVVLNARKMPAQLQLHFVAEDGSEWLKVITTEQEITDDERLVEQGADQAILASHVIRAQSELIQRGVQSEEIDQLARNVLKINSNNRANFDEAQYRSAQNILHNVKDSSERGYKAKQQRESANLSAPRNQKAAANAAPAAANAAPSGGLFARARNMMQYVSDAEASQYNEVANMNSDKFNSERKRASNQPK